MTSPAAQLNELGPDTQAVLTRILGAIEEYVYTGEFLAGGGYRVLFAGPCREQFLGLAAEEARTAVWRDHVHPDDLAVFDDAHDGAADSGRLDVEYRMAGADGIVRRVRDRGRMRTEDGRRFLDGSILDVSAVHAIRAELEAARRHSDLLASIDPLTGAANRRSLARLLEHRADGHALGVLLVDLDRFKPINDLFGHAAGDAVLVAVAERLRSRVREQDLVVRLGGEEFLLLLDDVRDESVLLDVAEAVRAQIEAAPVDVGDEPLEITVSVGAALAPAGVRDIDGLLAEADRALYEAKRAGRNRVQLASAPSPAGDDAEPDESGAFQVARAMSLAAGALPGHDAARLEASSRLAARVARRMGLSGPRVLRCRLAALVHPHGEALIGEVAELQSLARIVGSVGAGAPGPLEARIVAAAEHWTAHGELDAAALDADVVGALRSVLEHRRERDVSAG